MNVAVISPQAEVLDPEREGTVPETPAYFLWSGWVGRVTAAILLIPALPILALIVVLTRLSSKGPGIYVQTRVGIRGRTFSLYKIRTMRNDAEAATGPVWTTERDPRVTPLGRILRSLHLDELPQLFNVVKGEMSLVGPRPERPEFTQHLAVEIPGYLARLCVKPGITGLAQINLPPDTDLESVRRKLEMDMQYIRAAGSLLDLKILMCTSLRMFGLKGLAVARLLGLRRKTAQQPHASCDMKPPRTVRTSEPVVCANGHAVNSGPSCNGHAFNSLLVDHKGDELLANGTGRPHGAMRLEHERKSRVQSA